MAFHVACPITCRRICFCPLGFPRSLAAADAKALFLDEVFKVHEFLKDPSGIRARDDGKTVQVVVPRVVAAPTPPPPPQPIPQPIPPPAAAADAAANAVVVVPVPAVDDESAAAATAQAKRAALQRKAAADMVAAEDFARRFEAGDLSDTSRGAVGEEHGQSNVMCRICFSGENEGSERARRMRPCKTCGKKYHRNCLKTWAHHRDLFHWSSWACPSCRICEVCRRTGDPNKLMFCKRCDGAYHCYCQHPSHKNVTSGVYVCPKHTKCHSCGSNVPGNGLSVRWFLGYTCCDACGRLFVKGNYCPVCLKVYRDSESTPMVCCDVCERWVHCHCDGISDEKYQQFQLDGNLHYKCATCRGECHQVKNHEDAAVELWKRKDEAERDLITSLRVAAGLPAHEEMSSISPYSDDGENGLEKPRSEYGRPLKLSLKGLVDKSPKKTKDSGRKSLIRIPAKKKEYQEISTSNDEANHSGRRHDSKFLGPDKTDEMESFKNAEPVYSSPLAGSASHTEEIFSVKEPNVLKRKFVDEVMSNGADRTPKVRIKSKSYGVGGGDDTSKHVSKSRPVKEKKLVINFGAKKINITKSPSSDTPSYQKERAEDAGQRTSTMVDNRHDGSANLGDAKGSKVAGREGNIIKLGKARSGAPDHNTKLAKGDSVEGSDGIPSEQTHVSSGKIIEAGSAASEPAGEMPSMRNNIVYSRKHSESRSAASTKKDHSSQKLVSDSSSKDHKPLLKFKLKKPNLESQISPQLDEEKSSVKGQRSKRKRPSPFIEKTSLIENVDRAPSVEDNIMDEIMDANWILKKLGKDAVGKRVEVQQLSDNSWHKGVVSDVVEGTSMLSVTLDDGKVKAVELGKQGVRFVSQKQKRSRT